MTRKNTHGRPPPPAPPTPKPTAPRRLQGGGGGAHDGGVGGWGGQRPALRNPPPPPNPLRPRGRRGSHNVYDLPAVSFRQHHGVFRRPARPHEGAALEAERRGTRQ